MGNSFFRFREFTVQQEKAAFKVGTDGVLLGALCDIPAEGKILDVGTGTGLIALMAAQRGGKEIVAIEPDHNSCLQATENVEASRWADGIEVKQMTFHEFFSQPGGKFNLILSNPPYFRNSLKNADPAKSLARHADSLTSMQLIEGAVKLLTQKGELEVIMPYTEGTIFIAEAALGGLYCNRLIKVKGTPKGEVIRLVMKFSREKKNTYERFLTIETGIRHNYTEEYREATKDFYL